MTMQRQQVPARVSQAMLDRLDPQPRCLAPPASRRAREIPLDRAGVLARQDAGSRLSSPDPPIPRAALARPAVCCCTRRHAHAPDRRASALETVRTETGTAAKSLPAARRRIRHHRQHGRVRPSKEMKPAVHWPECVAPRRPTASRRRASRSSPPAAADGRPWIARGQPLKISMTSAQHCWRCNVRPQECWLRNWRSEPQQCEWRDRASSAGPTLPCRIHDHRSAQTHQ